ncbi:MAG: phosphoenolpyruvate--protein phosphotransferase [Pseudomonadota bacterium]|jgi:phosphotransferase system enzyme I (PtsI)
MSFTLHGLGVSGGIAIGRAMLISHATLEVAHLTLAPRLVDKEIQRFEAAIAVVREELLAMKQHTGPDAPPELDAFIDLHCMFLSDPDLVEVPKSIIRERGCNAEWALVQQMEHLVDQFEQFEDAYLRERKHDVVQVVERVVKELMGKPGRSLKASKSIKEENLIVIAHDLSPTDVIAFKEHRFASFVTDVGGATSHTAILARSLAIPAIVGVSNARALIREGETLIVDGVRGVLIVNPDQQILQEYRLRKNSLELEKSKLKRLLTAPSATLDEVPVSLLANIELPGDVDGALKGGADGIGLFRTEFLFLGRGDMPSEEEQFEAYKKVIKGMDGRPVTIRTFDLGGDKTVDKTRTATNPALGLRAIRLSLSEPQMFQAQLRAILRASKYGKVKLLIPMLAHASEIDATLAAIEQAKSSLRGQKVSFDEHIEVGGMIEIPGAALAVGMFLRRLQFLSIGTNDLIQYTLAIDRMDEQVSSLYDPLHPAVLMLIAHTLSSAEKVGVPVSVCGELAGDPNLTRLLLGMGLRQFSMHPSQILSVKSRVLKSDIGEVTPQVRRMLRLEEPQKLREALEKLNGA